MTMASPRGARLRQARRLLRAGLRWLYYTTFDAGVYNKYRSRYVAAFERMKSQGYNIARIFLDERVGCGIG